VAALYTIDASVFLNAYNPYEEGHEDSNRLLARLQQTGVPIIVPTLLLPEVAAAVRRGCGDAELARSFAGSLRRLPHLVLVPLDLAMADQASAVAGLHGLRGSDAVYAAVALRFGSTLVTLDREQRQRVAAVVHACEPSDLVGE
jgi:predicted nucleic acid-binding protein